MSSSITAANYAPEFKGYRIRQQIANQQSQEKNQSTMIKVIVKNQTGGIPKVRHDVICNGKLYPFIPLFSFTSEDDLGIVDQISTIVLRDENDILCQILSKKVTQIKVAQFKDLKERFRQIFALELRVDPQELFLIIISDEISDDAEFNEIFDSITETQFINLLKKVYENCPEKVILKILRKIAKYFNSTKARPTKSVERLKRLMKLLKSTDESGEAQQKQIPSKKSLESPKKTQSKQEQKKQTITKEQGIKKNKQVKKQYLRQAPVLTEQKTKKNIEQSVIVSKPVVETFKQSTNQAPKEQIKVIKKNTEPFKKTQKPVKKDKIKKVQKTVDSQNEQQKPQQNESDWKDVDGSNESDEEVKNTIGKMAFHADDSDDDLKYLGPKKKNKKKNNVIVPIDSEQDQNLSKKAQRLKKQKKNQHSNSPSNQNNIPEKYRKISKDSQDAEDDIVEQKVQEKKNNNWQNNKRNGSGKSQSLERDRRQFTREKKIDPRILLGINGATDLAWRQRMRPPKYPRDENGNDYRGRTDKQNKQSRVIKASNSTETPKKQSKSIQPSLPSKNLTLQKIFSIPEDINQGKKLKFQKRNYNLFVNKLFWVNIIEGQVTIQKDGKGYIRKCQVQIIDNGNGIMAEGVTLNIDGLSNLEDGGTAFGDPVFEQFTPDGQWFHIVALDVYAYV